MSWRKRNHSYDGRRKSQEEKGPGRQAVCLAVWETKAVLSHPGLEWRSQGQMPAEYHGGGEQLCPLPHLSPELQGSKQSLVEQG